MIFKTISVIRGYGIGPSIVDTTLQILDHMNCGLSYECADAGLTNLENSKDLLPELTLTATKRNSVVLEERCVHLLEMGLPQLISAHIRNFRYMLTCDQLLRLLTTKRDMRNP